MTTSLALFGAPGTNPGAIPAHPLAGLPPVGQRIPDFDVWRGTYGGAIVTVMVAGTTQLATLYSDPFLTLPIANPITLLTLIDQNGLDYGKFSSAVYCYQPYYLATADSSTTGIVQPPINALPGLDVSKTVGQATRGIRQFTLSDFFDRIIHMAGFGTTAATDGAQALTATLLAAIGAASAQGGGEVIIPGGSFALNPFTLPGGVILKGQGKGATTLIMQSGQNNITFGGDGCGLRDMTVDGITLTPNSILVYSVSRAGTVMDRVVLQRAQTAMMHKGIAGNTIWNDLSISNCTNGAELRGDADAANTNAGSAFQNLEWRGGTVATCVTEGVALRFFDKSVTNVHFEGVEFSACVGPAVLMHGVRDGTFKDCAWLQCTSNVQIEDDQNALYVNLNTTRLIKFDSCTWSGGSLNYNGTCYGVIHTQNDFAGVSFNLTIPLNPIVLQDCVQDAATTSTGVQTLLQRQTTNDRGTFAGITTDNNPTTAWSRTMFPGETGIYSAKVTARRLDGTDWSVFWIAAGSSCTGSTMTFNLQTVNFAAGKTLTGRTSGASARIAAVTQSSGSGTLTLADITGTFQLGELIQDTGGGSATANGALTVGTASLDGGGNTAIRASATSLGAPPYPSVAFDTSGILTRLRVTGVTSNTWEWTCAVEKLVA